MGLPWEVEEKLNSDYYERQDLQQALIVFPWETYKIDHVLKDITTLIEEYSKLHQRFQALEDELERTKKGYKRVKKERNTFRDAANKLEDELEEAKKKAEPNRR